MHDAGAQSRTADPTGGRGRGDAFVAVPHLFLVLECSRPWAGGAQHNLAVIDEVWIGRGTRRGAARSVIRGSRILELRVPDARMSQTHARIARVPGGFVFEDLGSTNGSRVGRSPVQGPVPLADGEVLEIGRTFFRFRVSLPTPPAALVDQDCGSRSKALPAAFATLLPELGQRLADLAKVAATRVPVLLLGETGTGKALLAQAVHEVSGRSGPLVSVQAGALEDESGFARSADCGTLFLDDIGDLPRSAQPALLRVLEGKVLPARSARPGRVDLRVICAAHHPWREGAEKGTSCADLFGRIGGTTIGLPPLRERVEDLGLLVASMLPRIAPRGFDAVTFTVEAARRLLAHAWPENIRELHAQLSAAHALAGDDPIDVGHLSGSGVTT